MVRSCGGIATGDPGRARTACPSRRIVTRSVWDDERTSDRTGGRPGARQWSVRRKAVGIALTAAATFGLAACGSSSSSPSTTTTQVPVTSTTTASSTTTTAASPTTTTTQSGSGGCATSALSVTFGSPNGTAGAIHYTITFHNTGQASCTLYGFPGVSFVSASGTQIGAPAVRQGSASTTVTLASGGNAYSSVAVTDPGIPPCSSQATADQVRIYPPGQTQATLVAAPSGVNVCSSPNTSAYLASTVTPVAASPL